MASFKTRRKHISKGGTQIGAGGSVVSELLYGQFSACVPQITASGPSVAASAVVSGLNANSKVFVMSGSTSNGVLCYAVTASLAGGISASFLSAGHAGTNASTLTFDFFAIV